MLMLIYYFMAFIAKQDLQTVASTCFFFNLGLFIISSFYHEAHTNEERHLLCSFISQCIIQIWKCCFPEEIHIYF